MRIGKSDLARAIDRCKSVVQKNEQFPALQIPLCHVIRTVVRVVQKNEQFPALQGVLVKDGYLTASNAELTVQVKLEGIESESLIIPIHSFRD